MIAQDTIAAIATARGAGGVAIIRVSGAAAHRIAAAVFRRRGGRGVPTARRVYVGKVVDPERDEILDEALAFGMQAPHSYTGEDVVEIQCHGGSLLSERILECVCRAGARPAAPGEFTKRAYLNGRLDLAQAEAVADLIAARSASGMRLAWSQLDGMLSTRVSALRAEILRARALCEVVLDFPDEDLPDSHTTEVKVALLRVRQELETLATTFGRGRLKYVGARVALVGRPNVGKSSLLNALVGRDRVLVSPIPGTTRDVVEATISVSGGPVVIMDTAGIRETDDLVESMGVERSLSMVAQASCVLAVFDGSLPLEPEDYLLKNVVVGQRVVAVVNKQDLPKCIEDEVLRDLLGSVPIVRVSATNQRGLDALVETLATVLHGRADDVGDDEGMIYRVRHYEAVRQAIDDVIRSEQAFGEGEPLELVALDLAAAAGSLGAITGDMTSEDVLDRVFADFCLGK